jgi:hypothetical protein
MLRAPTRKPRKTTLLREAKIDEEAKTLTLVLDLQEPTPSASGKTLVVATTLGVARQPILPVRRHPDSRS